MNFDDVLHRVGRLLKMVEWPTEIVWIRPENVLVFPCRLTVIFRADDGREAERSARRIFRERFGVAPAVSFYSPGHAGGRTFVYVESVEELADGEQMFVEDGLKVSVQGTPTPVVVTNSRIRWWLYRKQYRAWWKSQQRALGLPAA